MGYRADMERCREYIKEHCTAELTAAELANIFGYSFFHFCHVFKSCNGMAIGEYLRDTRLSRAAVEIVNGKSVTDTALGSGFVTLSGFNRAFRRRFGISPTKYKKLKGGTMTMKSEIKKMAAFTAVGYTLAPPPESKLDIRDNGAYWLGKDFKAVSAEDYAKLAVPGHGEIGAWMHPSDKTGEFFYFFGPITKDKSFVPKSMTALDIPAAEYAVFTVPKAADAKGLHENVKKAWKFIFNDWFDDSGYKFVHAAIAFEYYLGDDTFIYVPVTKK
jgi:AraC family transcriptional regulator